MLDMRVVIQQEVTGCGIATVAMLAGVTYESTQRVAHRLDISAQDPELWSDTKYVRTLLRHYGVRASDKEQPFHSWDALPDLALLAIKWRMVRGRAFWHWSVFYRAAWAYCNGPEARTPDESTHRFRSYETKVVHRNSASCHGAWEEHAEHASG